MDLRMNWIILALFASSSRILAENSTIPETSTAQATTNASDIMTNITTGAAFENFTETTLGGTTVTDNETAATAIPTSSQLSTTTVQIIYNTTNVTVPTVVNQSTTSVATTVALNTTTTISNATSSTQNATSTTAPHTTESDLATTPSSFEETTETLTPITIVEKITNKWNESFSEVYFTNTSLNESAIKQASGDEVVETIVLIFKENKLVELQSIDESTLLVAEDILQHKPSVLNENIKDQFIPNMTMNLYRLYVISHWFHDEVLCKKQTLQDFVANFSLSDTGNSTSNSSLKETSLKEFLEFVFIQPSNQLLFEKICEVANEENVTPALCSTPAPSTTQALTTTAVVILGTQDFENTWNQIRKNFTFLSDLQKEQLQNVTSSDMTDALVSYVNNLSDIEVENLVKSNFTRYAGNILRGRGNSADEIIGEDVVQQLGDDVNRTDIFFVYMTFINAFVLNDSKFEAFIRSYVSNSSAKRRKRAVGDCDTTSINADGIICHVIATEGSNTTALLEAVCAQLDSGNTGECSNTIPESEPTDEPVNNGLSTAEIIGIVLGCIFGLLLVMIIAFLIWKYCCSNKRGKVSPRGSPVDYSDDNLSNRNQNNQHRDGSRMSAESHSPVPDNNGGPR